MNIRLITVGEPHEKYAVYAWQKYSKLLSNYHNVIVKYLKDNSSLFKKTQDATKGSFVVILDEKGRQFSSRKLARFIEDKAIHGTSDLSFVIGGPNGHSDDVKKLANTSWSLSDLTLPHDMAQIVALEALYRASSINAGHPYHRD